MSDDADLEVGETVANRENFEMTETSYESYCGKMKDSLIGVGIGFLLFFGSIGLLIWNEGRAVSREKDLEEGQVIVTSLRRGTNGRFDLNDIGSNELVHVTAQISTASVLSDEIFGIDTGVTISDTTTNNNNNETESSFGGNDTTVDSEGSMTGGALRLRRNVQMYQWKESSTQKQVKTATGGTRTETTYSYDEVWSVAKINSDFFNNKDTRLQNPNPWPFDYQEWEATDALLGNQFQLASTVLDRMIWYEPLANADVNDIPDLQLQERVVKESQNTFFYQGTKSSSTTSSSSSSLSNPSVGDMLISWDVVRPQTISIIALLDKSEEELTTFSTSRGGSLLLLRTGEFTAEEMFQQALDENEQTTWILRFVGFLLMVVSILLILQPFSTAMDIIPFIGDFLGDGLEKCIFPCVAFCIAIPLSLLIISLAWLAYRPAIAAPIFVACGALICFCMFRGRATSAGSNDTHNGTDHNNGQPQEQSSSTKLPMESPTYPSYPNGNNGVTSSNNTNIPSFSQALDNPPPSFPSSPSSTTPPPPSAPIEEAEINMEEVDIVVDAPYVPQVYKP